MSQTIHAIYEHGVLRPIDPINLPERCEVELEIRQIATSKSNLDAVYSVLSRRFRTGETDVAARHDEHQP